MRLTFAKCRRGTSAVEFAIIAPIFLALTFSILEAGYYFFVSSAVEAANAKAARLIRTGQVQSGGTTKDQFFDEICKTVKIFGDCNAKLTVDVQRYATFAELAAAPPDATCRDSDPDAVAAIPYDAGAARDIVRVRVCYLYRNITPGIGLDLEQAAGGAVKMISTSIFRNEPFDS